MMNLIEKFFNRTRSGKTQVRENFKTFFFSQPEHAWILETCHKPHFDHLFDRLPSGVLEALMTKYPVVFLRSEDFRPQRQPGMSLTNTVVVFPEFQTLLQSSKRAAVAYLAHELAFILLELEGGVRGDSLMAEVEADKFVSDLGLTFELEDLLLMLDECIEKRLRLTYLTINHFKDQ